MAAVQVMVTNLATGTVEPDPLSISKVRAAAAAAAAAAPLSTAAPAAGLQRRP
eukprot:COSAG01_NODE_2928_length_6838_cov_168.682149_10_plen_53_part_00